MVIHAYCFVTAQLSSTVDREDPAPTMAQRNKTMMKLHGNDDNEENWNPNEWTPSRKHSKKRSAQQNFGNKLQRR